MEVIAALTDDNIELLRERAERLRGAESPSARGRVIDDLTEEARRQIPVVTRGRKAKRLAKARRQPPYAGGTARAKGLLKDMGHQYEMQPSTVPAEETERPAT